MSHDTLGKADEAAAAAADTGDSDAGGGASGSESRGSDRKSSASGMTKTGIAGISSASGPNLRMDAAQSHKSVQTFNVGLVILELFRQKQ